MTTLRRRLRICRAFQALLLGSFSTLAACGGSPGARPDGSNEPAIVNVRADTNGPDLVPPGFGTLRQDEIAIRIQREGVIARLIPLDERVIRLLSPDSYRALRDLGEERRAEIAEVVRRTGVARASLWLVSFFGIEQGEGRFSPLEVVLTSAGRDFRALDIIPLTTGFGDQRVRQRETQTALYVFDGQVDVTQPIVAAVESSQSATWTQQLPRLERERALVRARASGQSRP